MGHMRFRRLLAIFLLLLPGSGLMVQGKLLPPATTAELFASAELVIHGRISGMPRVETRFADLTVETLGVAKGETPTAPLIIRFNLIPPDLPDRPQPLPEHIASGAEFIFFLVPLATPSPEDSPVIYTILDQWQEAGIRPYSEPAFSGLLEPPVDQLPTR